jgi:uncharacterized membrane-anchored protein
MRNWVRWTLLAQVLFFSGWAGIEEWKRHEAPAILLETVPVDPRDLLSGQYLMLGYRIGQVDQLPGFPNPAPTRSVKIGVLLKPGNTVNVGGRGYTLWQAVRCQVPPPSDLKTDEGVWVLGEWVFHNNVIFGIERYYFTEKRVDEFSALRSGKFYVEAKLAKGGKLAIQRLVY